MLLYIPGRVRKNGEEIDLTLQTLIEIGGGPRKFGLYNQSLKRSIERHFGDSTASGWILMSKKLIPGSREKSYESQKNMVEEYGFQMPNILEAFALILMVFAVTSVRLYDIEHLTPARSAETYTSCIKGDNLYPIFGGGPIIDCYDDDPTGVTTIGVAALRKF